MDSNALRFFILLFRFLKTDDGAGGHILFFQFGLQFFIPADVFHGYHNSNYGILMIPDGSAAQEYPALFIGLKISEQYIHIIGDFTQQGPFCGKVLSRERRFAIGIEHLEMVWEINGYLSVLLNSKKRDDLQDVIAFLRDADVDAPLQYENFRD